jgi:Sushi repeat (SCR repeat)
MRMVGCLLWALLALWGCEQSPVVTPTQVTARIAINDDLKSTMTHLRVRAAFRLGDDSWRTPVTNTFPASVLNWPVEIPIFPRSVAESPDQFEIVAEALQNEVPIAQARVITAFLANKHVAIPLHLYACRGASPICEPSCIGIGCSVCGASGVCEPVVTVDPGSLIEVPGGMGSNDAGGITLASDAEMVGLSEAGFPLGSLPDAAMSNPDAMSPALSDAGMTGPAVDCDNAHPCSPGFTCSAMKCVSLCTQTQCDPNATCSLVNNAPVCSCNGGYIAMTGAATVTCLKDVACEDLGCDTNASCVLVNQQRACQCKVGYTGSGTSCTAVSCPSPTITNGTVSTTSGSIYNSVATYRCNTGFQQAAGGTWTRTCGSSMQWSGTQPSCTAITCLPLSNPPNGMVSTAQGLEFGDVATYTCNPRHALSGSAQRTCTESGWSGTTPGCTSTCKNGSLDSGEMCDPTVSPWNVWTCSSTCEARTTIYTACTSTANCTGAGEICYSGTCGAACSTSNPSCPAAPAGAGPTAFCAAQVGACVAVDCSSAADCAPTLACKLLGGAINRNACTNCNVDADCAAGKTCQLFSMSPNLGHCI